MALSLQMSRKTNSSAKQTLIWSSDTEPILRLARPLVLESSEGPIPSSYQGDRAELDYDSVFSIPGSADFEADARFHCANGVTGSVTDNWTAIDSSSFTVSRKVNISEARPHAGLRVGLNLQPAFPEGMTFNDMEYYAPNACYNLNDLNEDGVCDYLDTQTLSYREDRLNALSVLGYHPRRHLAIALSRADPPKYDDWPDRQRGQTAFLQDTDVGSLGFQPDERAANATLFTASYPFIERDRCNALLVKERVPWGAFRPVSSGDSFSMSYTVRIYNASSAHDAIWSIMRAQFKALDSKPVTLDRSLDEIARSRLNDLPRYFLEDSNGAAGFVTNCHPQDGKQLGNVVQYGFTGMNIMNATNLLRASARNSEEYLKAMKVVDFYVSNASQSPFGFTHGLYNMDLKRHDSWWTGLLLPLAYAEPGQNLERLMGPLYAHQKPVIEALAGSHGVYLRCVLEETEALLSLYESLPSGPQRWLDIAIRFGQFLLGAQEKDGSWRRAYSLEGEPLTKPDFWFGQTHYQQRSSTALVVPLLLRLSHITKDEAYSNAAIKAGRFVREQLVDKVKHNGGIHDPIYAKPQLIDHESIHFCCRAMLALYEHVGGRYFLEGTVRAAQLSASWVMLWDVPLPSQSTLGKLGFRSTGMAGCDSPGAGYVHPMGVIAVPDLVRVSQLTGDPLFLDIAELCLMGNNQNVGKRWGYPSEGLQEEGLLLSPWFLDDPMFGDSTGFGSRLKGEGNKTCLPWISAVTVWAGEEMKNRFGTYDFRTLRQRFGVKPLVNGVH